MPEGKPWYNEKKELCMDFGIERIEEVIDRIEEGICEEIDYPALAASLALSLYEFRRIFAFIVGCPLSDYVRRRRLSLAARDLVADTAIPIEKLAARYGYATAAAFSRAFREFHGISPSACRRGEGEVAVFLRPRFSIRIESGNSVSYKLLCDTAYSVCGYTAPSPMSDTVCCEEVWSAFYARGEDKRLSSDTIFAVYTERDGTVDCCIGERRQTGGVQIAAGRWLSVRMNTTDDALVNKRYNEILCDLLPSIGLVRRAGAPTVEIFPRDMSEEGFPWEIRIPIE